MNVPSVLIGFSIFDRIYFLKVEKNEKEGTKFFSQTYFVVRIYFIFFSSIKIIFWKKERDCERQVLEFSDK